MAFSSELFSSELFSQSLFGSNLFPARWTPPTDGTNPLWLKADSTDEFIFPDPLEPTLAGTWLDKGGNGNHITQGTQVAQPAYDSINKEVSFVGGQFLERTSGLTNMVNANGTYTLFMVHDVINPSLSSSAFLNILFNTVTETPPASSHPLLYYGKSNDDLVYAYNSAGGLDYSNVSTKTGDTILYNSVDADSNSFLYANGTLSAQSTVTLVTGATSDCFKIGDISIQNIPIKYKEIIFINDVLTTAERQRYEGYLAWKYNLVAQLPVGHPYKLSAPTV